MKFQGQLGQRGEFSNCCTLTAFSLLSDKMCLLEFITQFRMSLVKVCTHTHMYMTCERSALHACIYDTVHVCNHYVHTYLYTYIHIRIDSIMVYMHVCMYVCAYFLLIMCCVCRDIQYIRIIHISIRHMGCMCSFL